MMVQKVCVEKGVGFIDLWASFVEREDTSDGLHLIGNGAAVLLLGCEFVRVVDGGTYTVGNLN